MWGCDWVRLRVAWECGLFFTILFCIALYFYLFWSVYFEKHKKRIKTGYFYGRCSESIFRLTTNDKLK